MIYFSIAISGFNTAIAFATAGIGVKNDSPSEMLFYGTLGVANLVVAGWLLVRVFA